MNPAAAFDLSQVPPTFRWPNGVVKAEDRDGDWLSARLEDGGRCVVLAMGDAVAATEADVASVAFFMVLAMGDAVAATEADVASVAFFADDDAARLGALREVYGIIGTLLKNAGVEP